MKQLLTLGKDIVNIYGKKNKFKVRILTPDISRTELIQKYLIDEGFLENEYNVQFHTKQIDN